MLTSRVTIVVASASGGEFLFRCLESLRGQCARRAARVVVVDRCGPEVRERVRREHPHADVLAPDLGHRPSVSELRREGALAARTEVVAVLEEHKLAPDGWLDAIESAFVDGVAAAGGPIRGDFPSLADWAAFAAEYHAFLPPWSAGEREHLAAGNVAYRRDALLRHRALLDDVYWEVALHPALRGQGRLVAVPAMEVRQQKPYTYGRYLGQRYLMSRVWGGSRRRTAGAGERLLHVALTPAMPLLLCARVTRSVLACGAWTGRYVAALPLLVPVWVVYAAGEGAGYLLGPGDAPERIG